MPPPVGMLVPTVQADPSDSEKGTTEAIEHHPQIGAGPAGLGAALSAQQGVAIEYDAVHMASSLVHVLTETSLR